MNLLPQQRKKAPLTEKQAKFLDELFDNGGNTKAAAVAAGYAEGSGNWLRERLS